MDIEIEDALTRQYGTNPLWDKNRSCFTVKMTDTHFVDVLPLLFTAAIVTTPKADIEGYDDRWCYHSIAEALIWASLWDPSTDPEPSGWHRHPVTGRRRPDGDPAREYINP